MRSRGSGNSDEFIREVDEAVRQDRWMTIWKQYNAYIIGASVAVVVGTSAGVGWQTYQQNQRMSEARSLAAATELLANDNPAEAASAFSALAKSASSGVGVIARLREAEAEKEAGNETAKIDILDQMASDDGVPLLYRRLAGLVAKQESFGELEAEALIGELDQAIASDNPWNASLQELKAIAQLKAGMTDQARKSLQELLDGAEVPSNLASRANELLNALGGPLDEDNQTVSQNATPEDTDTQPTDGEVAQ